MSTQAEVRELEAHIRKAGFKIVKTGNGAHKKILDKKGAVVTDKNGPLILSGSPSEHRWREMHVQRLMDAGVLKSDPWKPTPSGAKPEGEPKGKRADLQDPAIRERMLASIQAKADVNREATAKLRARLEPIIAKLGGWRDVRGDNRTVSGVSITEYSEVMSHWATVRGRVEFPKKTQRGTAMNMGALTQAVRNLKIPGNTVGEWWMPLFTVFVDELEHRASTPGGGIDLGKAADRYRELLREQKGIPVPIATPPAGEPTGARPEPLPRGPHEPPPVDVPQVVEHETIGPRHDVHAPKIALEAVARMVMGYAGMGEDGSDGEWKRILEIGAEIAELELNRTRR